MQKNPQEQKDIYLIAKRLTNDQKPSTLQQQLQQRYNKQSQQALKMINAYRKVQNIKTAPINNKFPKTQQQKQQIQPKSTYANKIKQTLRQLNANKAKEYEKLQSKNTELKSEKNIKSLQVNSEMSLRKKSQNQRKLVGKAADRIFMVMDHVVLRVKKIGLRSISDQCERQLVKDYSMADKYRLFRVFSLWKQITSLLKAQNQRHRKQIKQKEIQGMELAQQFFIFKTSKKVLSSWSRLAKNQKKKRKYEEELKKIQQQKSKNQHQTVQVQQREIPQNTNGLQNKLKGFLSGLKEKIQTKDSGRQLKVITQKQQQSQQSSQVISNLPQQQIQHFQAQQQHQQHHQSAQSQHPLQQPNPKQPLSNQQLQKRRQQIYERSKNRKQALEKLKQEKMLEKKKEEEERKQLEKKIQEEQKRVRELKYREFQERKKLEKQWQLREIQLNKTADQWNRLRIMKHYGLDPWKSVKINNQSNAKNLSLTVQKIMLKHAGQHLFQLLQQNLQTTLNTLYAKMSKIYHRNLKKRSLICIKTWCHQSLQQKLQLQAFHQSYRLKIFFKQWSRSIDQLRIQNLEEQRPLIKRANEYHRVCLLFKSLKALKSHAVQSKKQKNINDQKQKIKSKIKNIISEKIQINYDQFL